MDNELILTAEELDEELHKDVEDVGFVDVSDRVEGQRVLRVHQAEPSHDGVNRDDHQNPNYLQLDFRLIKMSQMLGDLVPSYQNGQRSTKGGKIVNNLNGLI
jgi:hypothetical protein